MYCRLRGGRPQVPPGPVTRYSGTLVTEYSVPGTCVVPPSGVARGEPPGVSCAGVTDCFALLSRERSNTLPLCVRLSFYVMVAPAPTVCIKSL